MRLCGNYVKEGSICCQRTSLCCSQIQSAPIHGGVGAALLKTENHEFESRPICTTRVSSSTRAWHKGKGRFLFRNLAPYFPVFRRSGSVSRSQLIVTSELFGAIELSSRLPYSSVVYLRCKSFPGSILKQPVS